MKKFIFLLVVAITISGSLKAQSLIYPNSITDPLTTLMPNLVVYPDEHQSLQGYLRGSSWGAGETFDYANVFGEATIKADYAKGFTKGYGFFKGEIRARNGDFFGVSETEIEIRDLYVGLGIMILK
ncbi:hypothetical protein NBRC110019_12360 [Neptunitalea chrysea]|uniref:Uncharacterized protein n=1 Tax=Neptunitalea chrysea TaxID=1647581 RepID=A0A9W6B6H4_9FLAO|nr:hypothetical protein [Neptunitalea chrysea]GLB52197.1 hypothetical protein NBRC110019_12360 [Neptunitalea chrysea]